MKFFMQKTIAFVACLVLVACGGGGGGGSDPAPSGVPINNLPLVADMSACFQINNANSANQINIPGLATALTLSTAAAVTSTVYFSTTTFAVTFLTEAVANSASSVTVARSKGVSTFAGLSSSAFNSDTLYSITPQSRTINASRSYDAAGTVTNVSTASGNIINLTVVPSQSQTVTSTRNNSAPNVTPQASRTVQTVNFVAREDVQTTAGLFKNACKVTFNGSTYDQNGNALLNTFSETAWYAPGWGRVKANGVSDTPRYSPSQNSFTFDTLSIITGSL